MAPRLGRRLEPHAFRIAHDDSVRGGLILLVVLAVRWLGAGRSDETAKSPSHRDALEILEGRFARGEIEKEDFEEGRRLLQ